ncbi:putative P-loop containing nucleoside triphosphate hydrolase [Rosa chinensis]|uniref:Putative P-loop containing nucleoside triphosphate hydrolase n=1 Tax=Rosa chinensis TaxID=74649 RepID=A0A2P6QL27_ROSCH|nr:putative P-loop containing nucleoside triphosphate hydrolase [Rosa chinensis]
MSVFLVLLVPRTLVSFRIKSQIIVLDNGQVVEQGPHDVLLSKAGRYAQLWGQQNNTIDALDATIDTNEVNELLFRSIILIAIEY